MEEARRGGRADRVRDWIRGRLGVPEPGRRLGAGLRGRVCAASPRRRGNGPGPAHQNDPSGQSSVRRAGRVGARSGHWHGQGG